MKIKIYLKRTLFDYPIATLFVAMNEDPRAVAGAYIANYSRIHPNYSEPYFETLGWDFA